MHSCFGNRHWGLDIVLALLPLTCLVFVVMQLSSVLPVSLWLDALYRPDTDDMRQMVFHYSALPRVAIGLLSGAALGLAGAILQHVLANPLAEPGTLGISAGSHFAMVCLLLWQPAAEAYLRDAAALTGAFSALLLVAVISLGGRNSPMVAIIFGLALSLVISAVANVLVLLNGRYLTSLFVWSSGTLNQNGWHDVTALAGRMIVPILGLALLLRPLAVLGIGSSSARALGMSPTAISIAALVLVSALSAFVTAFIGVFGFLGLAAPAVARSLGARTLKQQVLGSGLVGAMLMLTSDGIITGLADQIGGVPTGAAIALLGAPLMIIIAGRSDSLSPPATEKALPAVDMHRSAAVAGFVLIVVLTIAVFAGRHGEGWRMIDLADADTILDLRLPRILAAAACGVLLSVGGVMMQRMTGNPLAAPELMGVSSGAACGVICVMLLAPSGGRELQILAGTIGAGVALAAMLILSRRSGFSPYRVIVVGMALTTGMSALVSVLIASGDPRLARLLTWLAGSTYQVNATDAAFVVASCLLMLPIAVILNRWLEILPLGETLGRMLGVPVSASRLTIMLVIAGATSVATVVIGPLTFVGLLAPHVARVAGAHRALPQIVVSALAGAAMLVFADWLGRQIAFPRQVPAGLLAALAGSPVLIFLLWRQGRPK